ncbi:phosphatidate cytidylyltransferase [Paenalcaligenes faecalis]|uniref:phosphatidate cytidylyltransferase n=1 Tax=Paenalcaligenes faecalis TaxID=2980099 RepID=UPI0022B960A0|nr:phosphatidate cytidylyltransferase [Paenalcaligenes faecalis]
MLKQRVITAVILIALLLGAILAPTPWALVLILCVMASCAIWEWLRLSYSDEPAIPTVVAVLFAGGSLYFSAQWIGDSQAGLMHNHPLVLISPVVLAYWVVGVGFMLAMAQTTQRQNRLALSLFGVMSIAVAWAALVDMWLYRGAWYLLSMMMVVWVADIAAYFAGRAFGKRKLAPRVSPGKTWAGLGGGVLAVVAWVFISAQWPGSFGAELMQNWSWFGATLFAILLALFSVVGDLFESLLKRRAGYKDSSQLLPGHGGVLDRIDALIPVAPLAAFVAGPWLQALLSKAA